MAARTLNSAVSNGPHGAPGATPWYIVPLPSQGGSDWVDIHSDHTRGIRMDTFNKKGKKGGNKKEVAAAADEQSQREEEMSHAREIARRAIFEFGAGLKESARGEGHPSEHQAGPSDPRLTRGSRALRGEERVILSPLRKRRRDGGIDVGDSVVSAEPSCAAAPSVASVGEQLTRRERAERYANTAAALKHAEGYVALAELGRFRVPRPSGCLGMLRGDNRVAGLFRTIDRSLGDLSVLAEGGGGKKRVQELERQADSLRKELGRVRRDLLQAKRGCSRCASGPAPRTSRAAPLEGCPEAQSAPKGAQQGGWVRVGKGGKPQKGAGQRAQLLGGVVNPPAGLVAAADTRQGGNALRGAPKRQAAAAVATQQQTKKAGRPKLPRNPAVLLTAVGERSYASLLREAEEKVDLQDIGIEIGATGGGLLIKKARNGGYLFEVPGKDGAAKADRLARELNEVLVGGAKVARPVKFAEVRLTGLVDGVTPDTVAAAFSKCGECPRDDLTVGVIRRSPGGLGAMWLRCPLAAALKVEARKGLRIGWAQVGVQMLEARPLQCYRCLKFGHLAAACTGPVDRKGRCFRCGGDGHVAKGCNADPRCLLCEKAGLNPGHRLGSRACPAAKAAWEKKRGGRPGAMRPNDTPGRSRGGKAKKGRATPAPTGGAVGPGTVFRVPDRPAPRAGGKEGGGDTRAPRALVRAEVPPTEAEGAGLDVIDVLSCTQPPSGREEYSARMDIAEEEEELAASSSFLLESGLGDWPDSPPQGET